jgi:acyl-CoA thioester hydrolase
MRAADFPYQMQLDVIFRDVDSLGHVNNAVYVTHMETVRTNYLAHLFGFRQPAELPVILAEVTCTYKAPAYFGETLRLGIGVSRFGNKSLDMINVIETTEDRLIATGKAVLVMFDYATQRTIPIPPEFRATIERFQGAWQGSL